MTTNPDHAVALCLLDALDELNPMNLSAEALYRVHVRMEEVLGDVEDALGLRRAVVVSVREGPTECENCATPIARDSYGRPRQYCSDACRQSAYRFRKSGR